MHQQLELQKMIESEQKRCSQKVEELEYEKKLLPAGHLSFHGNSYYHVIYKDGTRIQRNILKDSYNQDKLIHDLKKKRHITKALPILKNNLKSCNYFLNNFQVYDMVKINEESPFFYQDFDYGTLLLPGDIVPKAWVNTPYKQATMYEEGLKHTSVNGLSTRSKSESIIATELKRAGLQFQYDPVEYFGSHRFVPDFKVLHPTQRRPIYWEHMGLMGNPQYACGALEKINNYGKFNIHVGDNLIITWESSDNPLTYIHVIDKIKRYLT